MGKRRKIKTRRFSLIHGQILFPALMHEPEFARTRSGSCGLHPAVLPGQVHLKPAPRTQSRGGTLLPAVCQSRSQQDNLEPVLHDPALDQAFGHAGGKAEISVYLERGMDVKKVGVDVVPQHGVHPVLCGVPVAKGGIKIDEPRRAPSGPDAVVSHIRVLAPEIG